jgi:hypothetical protein
MRETMGPDGYGLIGLDQVRDPAVLEAAYNDAGGIAADFTLNLLVRLNRELDADFDLKAFCHRAVYSADRERIETSIVSLGAQRVHLPSHVFEFAAGEEMQVEISQKYTDASFARLAADAGLAVEQTWKDADQAFALALVRPAMRSMTVRIAPPVRYEDPRVRFLMTGSRDAVGKCCVLLDRASQSRNERLARTTVSDTGKPTLSS